MAPRKSFSRFKIVAKLVTDTGKRLPCSFCHSDVDDELTYGKLYAIGDIQCHYFCVLLSSCLIQKGKDEDGLFGFIYQDILAEIERAKKHKCSYCSRSGANLGCSVSQCRKQFHLPCGRQRNAVSLFYGNYKSFCQLHAPKQKIPPAIMANSKQRMKCDNKMKKKQANFKDLKELSTSCDGGDATQTDIQSVCVICYEAVDGYPTVNTFWPPCCARDAWFHRSCLQRMALSAGMHYLKCPLCNDKENFYQAVISQGYYVPDRDAAWELEQNAFAEIYDREIACSATHCQCPMGRSHDADQGPWCIKLCLLCGSSGAHNSCLGRSAAHVCAVCSPAAPAHIELLATSIEAVISQEQRQSSSRNRRGPVMSSRMSLRRTKRNVNYLSSCSSSGSTTVKTEVISEIPTNTSTSRIDLNLKTPKKQSGINSNINTVESKIGDRCERTRKTSLEKYKKGIENIYISPRKMLEDSLSQFASNKGNINEELVEELREKFKKPKPLSEKRKIVADILNGVFDSVLSEPVEQYNKCDLQQDIVHINDDSPPSNCDKENMKTPKKHITEQNSFSASKRKPSTDLVLKFKQDPENIYPTLTSPKKLKTVDNLKDSSLEISAKDEIINVDMIKMEKDTESCMLLKNIELQRDSIQSLYNKENLKDENSDFELQNIKDAYLNNVGLQRVKKVIFANKSLKKKRPRKTKLDSDEIVLKYESKKRKKRRKNISIKDKNIKVRIKWRKEKLKLKITDSKKKSKSNKYKQYILECSSERCATIKPNNAITPLKKNKGIKLEKSPDNLVQTSIHKFFKVKAPAS